MIRLQGLVVFWIAASLSACSHISLDPSFSSLSGIVSYRQRIALQPEAVVLVQLVDVTRSDQQADIVAEQRIERPGQVPVKFELRYDEHAIVKGHRYAVMAAIYQGQRLIFSSPNSVPVLAADSPGRVEVILDPVSG